MPIFWPLIIATSTLKFLYVIEFSSWFLNESPTHKNFSRAKIISSIHEISNERFLNKNNLRSNEASSIPFKNHCNYQIPKLKITLQDSPGPLKPTPSLIALFDSFFSNWITTNTKRF